MFPAVHAGKGDHAHLTKHTNVRGHTSSTKLQASGALPQGWVLCSSDGIRTTSQNGKPLLRRVPSHRHWASTLTDELLENAHAVRLKGESELQGGQGKVQPLSIQQW